MSTLVNNRKELLGFQKSYAFVIGINHYPKINGNLKSAVNDARALAKILKHRQGFDHVELLIAPTPTEDKTTLKSGLKGVKLKMSATTATFRKLLERIKDPNQEPKINPQDCIVFYYAGHGKPGTFEEGPAGYLLPSNATPAKARLKNESLIPMEDVFLTLKELDCHHTLLILDCCFAGKFRYTNKSRGMGREEGGGLPLYPERFERYKRERAWQVLVSAGPHQTAADWLGNRQEKEGGLHSPFAEALLEALEGKAEHSATGKKHGDGVLTSHELFLYLWDKVERLTKDGHLGDKSQYPDLFPMGNHAGGQFVFFDPNNKLNFAERKLRNPYQGLRPFEVADSDFFFGRKAVIKTLIEKFQDTDLLIISGASGSGKSSLAKAGLFPAIQNWLDENGLKKWEGSELLVLRPGLKPWSGTPIEKAGAPILYVGLKALIKQLDKDKQQFLLLDQLEELFTEGASEEERMAFEEKMIKLYETAADHQLKIIITLRSDYEWQLEKSKFGEAFWRKAEIGRFLYRLPPMKMEELHVALVRPALEEMYEFETEQLVQTILEEIGFAPGALPMLSFTMNRFYELTDKDQRVFTLPNYQKLGGVNGALSKYADEVYEALEKKDKAYPKVMRKLMLRMVQLNDGSYGRRRVYLKPSAERASYFINEFNYLDQEQDAVETVLRRLEQSHMILAGSDRVGDYYEPVHDALIKHWISCKQWIADFGTGNLSLQRELWQAVLDSKRPPAPKAPDPYGYEAEKGEDKAADKELTTNFSKLWESNAKLLQVIRQITAGAKDFLLSDKKTIIEVALPHIAPEDQPQFIAFWDDCYDKAIIPDLNSVILSGYSTKLLMLCVENGDHWLNQAEVNFIKQSWEKRIEDILEIKKQRNEAIAAQQKIQQQIEQTLNAVKTANTSGKILKEQVLKGHLELNSKDIHGQLVLTSIILDIEREKEKVDKTSIQRGYYDADVAQDTVLSYIKQQHHRLGPILRKRPQLRMNEEWVDIAPFEGAPNAITYLQFFLCQAGFLSKEKLSSSDGWGIYGYETLAGIRLFQEYVRVEQLEEADTVGKPDGIVGPKTWQHILSWSEKSKQRRFGGDEKGEESEEFRSWSVFLGKLKKHKQQHPGAADQLIELMTTRSDTRKVSDWIFDPAGVSIIGIRRTNGETVDKTNNEDIFVVLINGQVYKFWGATAPNAKKFAQLKPEFLPDKGFAYLAEGQHIYRLAWQNKRNAQRVYRALIPAEKGVFVFRSQGASAKLDADDIAKGLEKKPNSTINFSWGGNLEKNWSIASSVIVGRSYFEPDGRLVDCSGFSAYNTRQTKMGRTRGAYNVFMDLLTTNSDTSKYITYTLINERDLAISPEQFPEGYIDELLVQLMNT